MTSGDGSHDAPVERAEGDDHDVLTFGEADARLAELLAAERAELARLRRETHPDPAHVRRLEERIALLESSAARYRSLGQTNDVFARRFGAKPSTASPHDDPPRRH